MSINPTGYWQKQLSRRRALQAAAVAGGGAAALALVGCGRDESGGGGVKGDASGLLSVPQDSTSKATRGGIYAVHTATDKKNLDVILDPGGHGVYSYMVRNKMVKYPNKFANEVEPDAMESWEVSGDGLQYTFKVRPNMKLDPRPPTNNRPLDAEDVKYTWDYYAELGNGKTGLANVAAKDAAVLGVEAPDSRTVVMKLAFPYAVLLPMLAFSRHMPIMPREAGRFGNGAFDARIEMRGSGAFRLTKRELGEISPYRRNPDWYDADKMYLDGLDVFVIPEYATQMAQFRAGALWSNSDIRQEDILPTKREMPELIMQAGEDFARGPQPMMGFGTLPGSPLLDERVRRAVSMLIDRDLWIDTFYNVSSFTKEGLPVEARWNSHVTAGFDGFWIDPKGKEIGEGGKNFLYNPAEAKALIRAAGYGSKPIETVLNFPIGPYGGSTFVNRCETLRGMWEANGDFKFKLNNPEYPSEWLAPSNKSPSGWNGGYHFGEGTFEGIILGSGNTYPEVDGHVQAWLRSGSIRVWRAYEDTYLDGLVDKQRQELNHERRVEIIKEIQRHAAKTIPGLAAVGSSPGFNLAQPWVGNRGLWQRPEDTAQSYMHIWFDQSKAKRA